MPAALDSQGLTEGSTCLGKDAMAIVEVALMLVNFPIFFKIMTF